ncbi:ZYBA0S05-02388g1_1 [Zygosaccharomyces bailii CLIB 213]|uniref:ZYBA0S05-02388g1_1 n=1 Tax=Zygosaccharomyces bailii (strain CLIB 213 / ATCC 58445 / CBS 680 / BCRC 21525 / NBRC 1098 / NCYC 1416 / NRRL Y-2227) TaxID=1333698 RepID=A0A8J2X8E1_ZYGB2|nr:ZYBA0S05-02388g1_1 [Zygosaccharomyces bailii CLIB 213]
MLERDTKVPRRRRKAVKSCTFCRKRKLKCDHGKPMCRQCIDRKLPNCIYTDDFNFQLTTDELFSDSPNIEMMQRIKELESKLAALEKGAPDRPPLRQQGPTPPSSISTSTGNSTANSSAIDGMCCGAIRLQPTPSSSQNNPLWEYRILYSSKGQNIVFGPTSSRTMVASQGERFQQEYKKLWEMIKPERDRWVVQNPASQLSTNASEVLLSTTENDTLINSVCKYLPSYKEMEEALIEFFDGYMHDFLQILDKDKVMDDFRRCVIPSERTFVGFGQPIAQLLAPDNDGNFYKVAVVLIIMYTVKTNGNVPPVVDKFFLSLSAINTASKLNFVERAQFLLLRYFCKVYCPNECSETPQVANLVSDLCDCSCTLGLSNADWWYRDKQEVSAPLYTLRNMWYWTLYADIAVSFEMGKSLFISDDQFDPSITFAPLDLHPDCSVESVTSLQDVLEGGPLRGRRLSLLLEYLKLGRNCVTEVNSRSGSGDIEQIANQLISFVEQRLLPIKFYTCRLMLQQTDMFDVVVLAPVLGMLLNLHNVARIALKSTITLTKNRIIKFGLLSLSLCVNTILCMFERDTPGPKGLVLALLLINPLLMRVLTEMYSLFFFRLSLFERGIVIATDQGIQDIDLHTLEVPVEDYYSFNHSTALFREIIDQLFDPSRSQLQKAISKSYQLTTSLALERVSRTVFDKGCTSRTITENNCNPEDAICQETLDRMTESFWSTYEQQSQELWSMKPEDFYTDFSSNNFDFDFDLK